MSASNAPPRLTVQANGTTLVTDAYLNGLVQSTPLATDLREFIGVSNMQVSASGSTTPGGRGAAIFQWNATSTATDNGTTVIQPNGALTGRWLALSPTVSISGLATFPNIAALRSFNAPAPPAAFVEGYYSIGDNGGGIFESVSSDTTSADNGGTVIVDAFGNRWHRYTGGAPINVLWFGADPTGATDMTAAHNGAAATGQPLYYPPGTFLTSGNLSPPSTGQSFIGAGQKATIITCNSAGAPVFAALATGTSNASISGFYITRSVTATAGAYGICTASSGTLDHVEQCVFQNLLIDKQYNGLHLGPTNFGFIRDVLVTNCQGAGVYMTNTTGTSTTYSNPLQWTLDHILSQENGGQGFIIIGTAMTQSGGTLSLGEWKNISTFANTGPGIAVVGSASCAIAGFRLGCRSFIGADGNSEIYLDTYGSGHQITDTFIEGSGQGPTGPTYSTPQSNSGSGIYITANNSGVVISGCNIMTCSNDGVYTAANLYSNLTDPVLISGCRIVNNGLAGTATVQNGVHHIGGPLTVTGCTVGQMGFGAGGGFQVYGVFIAADTVVVVGNNLVGNKSAATFSTVPLTNSVVANNRTV